MRFLMKIARRMLRKTGGKVAGAYQNCIYVKIKVNFIILISSRDFLFVISTAGIVSLHGKNVQ